MSFNQYTVERFLEKCSNRDLLVNLWDLDDYEDSYPVCEFNIKNDSRASKFYQWEIEKFEIDRDGTLNLWIFH